MIKNSNKNHFLALSLMIFFSFSITVLVFSPVSFVNIAKALNPSDYNKLTGESLGVADWNRLDSDFIAKSGDTMSGPLVLSSDPAANMQAATKQYVDNATIPLLVSDIKDTASGDLKMICGTSPSNSWTDVTADRIRMTITTNTGFSSTPMYFTSLSGGGWHYDTAGATSIYSPSSNNFIIQIKYFGTNPFSAATVNSSWHWRINWCAVGN